jgi:CBS domain-containing protein
MKEYGRLKEDQLTKSIENYTAAIPSTAYLGVAAAAIGASVVFQITGQGKWGNFVGQWVPTWLLIGLYNKIVKLEGHDQFDRDDFASDRAFTSFGSGASGLQLKDFINYRVETAQPGDSLRQAAIKMRDLDVGSLPVCDGQRLQGAITDRDITIRATAKGDDPNQTKVQDAMTPDVVYCYETDTVETAARKMQEHQIRRIFVVNQDKELVGITSLGELATVTRDRKLAGKTLEAVSEESGSKSGAGAVHEERINTQHREEGL